MKLYIGGVYQGQEELARAENPGLPCYPDFHEAIRRAVLEAHQDPREFARQFCAAHPDAVVIGSDTIVTPDGVKALGKPRDRGDAVRTLTELSGKWHSVCTGIAVIGRAADNTSKKIAETVETKVKFLDLTKEECERYADTGEPLDKAGSYGIQGRGGALVEKIDGDYYSVVGLPVSRLRVILRDEFGINLL